MLGKDAKLEHVIKNAYSERCTQLQLWILWLVVFGTTSQRCRSIFVTHTASPSYLNRNPTIILTSAEKEKKKKGILACEDRHI